MGGLFRGGIFAVKIISANMPPHFYRNYAPPQVCLARLDFLRQNVFMPPPIPHHIQGSHGRHQISIGTPLVHQIVNHGNHGWRQIAV